MTMQSAVKAIAFGFAAMLLATAGAARADEGDEQRYTGNNEAQVDAAEAGNPHSVLNKDQSNAPATSTLTKDQPAQAASTKALYQAELRAAEAVNPHSVDSRR